jgi:hypothetical protein
MNCLKILILLPPVTFLIPISTERSDARATDNEEKFREAIRITRKARPEKIQTYL